MKYFFGFLASIVLIILVVVLIVRGFSGNSKPEKIPDPLVSYANTSKVVEYTADSVVNADQQHKAMRIAVARDEVKIDIMTGYNDTVVQSRTYPNNQAAYAEFLRALDVSGYTKGDPNPELKDERGQCATGSRYVFAIRDGANTTQKYWSTSCGKSGTFKGSARNVISLFQLQVPDYGRDGFSL